MKYPEKESATLEFKRELPNFSQISKTVVSFCNMFGGKIIIGVDDQQNIIGIDESSVEKIISSLQQSIYTSCSPTILPTFYTQRIHDKMILVIEVSPGVNKPYFVSALGLNDGTFIRAGAHTMQANALMIQELIWRGKSPFVDEMPVYSARKNDIDQEKFSAFLSEHRPHYKFDLTSQLTHYKILTEEHRHLYPTLGGLLLFGKEPQRFFSESFIICSHFQGISGRKALASQDCIGNLFDQLKLAMHFVTQRLHQQFEIKKIKRHQQLEIPEIALREIIINAIVHRDYHLTGPIKIAIYDDRVEVFSPGNFPGPLKTSQLEMGITYIRNYIICKLFREAGYIEKLGSGFLTLFDSYRKADLPTPQVIEGIGFVKCILPRPGKKKTQRKENVEEDNILRLFYTADFISVQDVMKELMISRQTAIRKLSTLIKAKKLIRVGKGPATKYKLHK